MVPTLHQPRFSDWLQPQRRWIALPSWVVSTGFHVGLLFLLIYLAQLRSCRHDIAGDGGDSWRQVGIVTREQNPPSESTESAESEQTQATEQAADTDTATTAVEQVPAAPPIELSSLPRESDPIIGVGPIGEGLTSPAITELIHAATGTGASASAPSSGEPEGSSFFGASDVGSRFVYVIDKSWSMDNNNALRAAKTELTRSLQRLTNDQQFQIIFYNTESVEVMRPRDNRLDMFFGTDSERLRAANQYQAVQAHGGTAHFPALKRALEFDPDVVFFLTDGKEPPLTAPDRASILRMNRGARIHCIEFGKGPQPGDPALVDPGNWLLKLANDNSGTYVYRDVNELFGRTP